MSSKDQDVAWDFTSVIDLIHSLSSKAERCTANDPCRDFASEEPKAPERDQELDGGHNELGNFDKLWRYLGQPLTVRPPAVNPDPGTSQVETQNAENGLAAASIASSISKGVRWRDEAEGADLADNDEKYNPNSIHKLSKARKKKLRMKKNAETARARSGSTSALAATSSENETEVEHQDRTPTKSRGSVIRDILYGGRPETEETAIPSTLIREAEAPKWPISNPRYFLCSSIRTPEALCQKPEISITEISLRKSVLIKKLQAQFMFDRSYLDNIGILFVSAVGSLGTDDGIHVFVDASNVGCNIWKPSVCAYAD